MSVDDRDPRVAELLERHTPNPEGTPDWARAAGRRPPRRLLRPAIAVAGVAVLIALVGVMFLVAPRDGDRNAASPFTDHREVGLAIRMRVTPVDATRLDRRETAVRAAAALVERARRAGRAAEATARPDGTIDAWIPVARRSSDVNDLVRMDAFAVFDLTTDVLARSRDPRVVLDAAQRLGPRDRSSRFYVVGAVEPPTLSGPWEVQNREAADPSTRYVPAGYAVIRAVSGEWILVRDTPVLATEDIASIGPDGDRVAVRLTPAGAERWRAAGAARTGLQLVAWFEGGTGTAVGSVDAGTGNRDRLDVAPADPLSASSETFEGAGTDVATAIPAMLRVTEERRTGPAEPRRGVPTPNPPAGTEDSFDPASTGLRRDTILRVLTFPAKGGGRPTVIWSALDATGREFVMVRTSTTAGLAEACELSPADPDIRTCGGEGGVYAYGRVSDRVARIDQPDAVVENGWFFARFPKSSPGPVPFRALDADGNELGRVDQDPLP